MGKGAFAITKAGNHLFSIQLLPKITWMREQLPPGAGDPTKLMALAENCGRVLTPVPWPALASHVLSTRRTLLLLVAFVETQQWGWTGHWCRKWRRASVTSRNLLHPENLQEPAQLCRFHLPPKLEQHIHQMRGWLSQGWLLLGCQRPPGCGQKTPNLLWALWWAEPQREVISSK